METTGAEHEAKNPVSTQQGNDEMQRTDKGRQSRDMNACKLEHSDVGLQGATSVLCQVGTTIITHACMHMYTQKKCKHEGSYDVLLI